MAHAPARHQQGRLEQKAVLLDPDQAVVDEIAHRRLEWPALRHGGAGEVHAGEDADALSVAHQECALARPVHMDGGLVQGGLRRHEHRRIDRRLAHACGHGAQRLRARLALAQRLQLVRDVLEEEAGEGRVVGRELDEILDRQGVADRLLADDEVVPGGLVHQDAAVEPVAALVDRHDLRAGALLDQALDHDVELVGQGAGREYRLPLAEETRRRPGGSPARSPSAAAGRTVGWRNRMPWASQPRSPMRAAAVACRDPADRIAAVAAGWRCDPLACGFRHKFRAGSGAEASASNASADVDDDRATRDRAP